VAATLALADFDLPTRSASGFLVRYILPRAGPIPLYSVLDRRIPFRLSSRQADIIIGMGHGGVDIFTGQNMDLILKVNKYSPSEVEGKVMYLLSCQTGVELGPDLVSNGAASFQGYTDDFVWVMDADLVSTPWADDWAAPCLMPVIDSINALLDGKNSKEAFDIQSSSYLTKAEIEEDELIRSLIEFNMDNAVLLGDEGARVRARPKIMLPLPPPPLVIPLRR